MMDFPVNVLEGRRRNQMLPLESCYAEPDLKINAADGSVIGVGDHVPDSGKLLVAEEVL
jgi:hypothetical protein